MRTLIPLLALTACTPPDAELHLQVWGEDAPVEGIPNDELAFVDGWAVTFDHFALVVGGFALADPTTEDVVAEDTGTYAIDLSRAAEPADVAHLVAPEGRYRLSWATLAPDATTSNVDVDEAVFAAMIAGGHNLHLAGSATKDDVTVTFDWGLSNATLWRYCENGADGTDGVALSADAENTAELDLHADHLFWDRLGVEEADLRFAPIAAWADEDGVVAFDDLANASTATLEGRDGEPVLDEQGAPLAYDDAGLGLANLRDFILYSARQGGHLNGVGECAVVDP